MILTEILVFIIIVLRVVDVSVKSIDTLYICNCAGPNLLE